MDIYRIPKGSQNATVARLMLSKASNGRVQASLKIEGAMTGFMEFGEFESVGAAERDASGKAQQRHADVLIIEDRT